MTRRSRNMRRGRRGLTLVELMLALVITAMVGLGVASMLAMVSAGATSSRDMRSALVRAHAAQIRLRSYIQPSLNLLQYDEGVGLAIWLQDVRPANNVHLSELRVAWFDAAGERITVERAQWPAGWTEAMKDQADVALPPGADYLDEMLTLRAQGHTVEETIVDDCVGFDATFDGVTPSASDRVWLDVRLRVGEERIESAYMAYGLDNYLAPGA